MPAVARVVAIGSQAMRTPVQTGLGRPLRARFSVAASARKSATRVRTNTPTLDDMLPVNTGQNGPCISVSIRGRRRFLKRCIMIDLFLYF